MNVKPNITEVEIGSPDYTVVPLNSREKKLLKAPSSSHYHKLLLELLKTVKLSHREIRKDSVGWNSGTPYEVNFEYGWGEGESAAFLLRVSYKIRMSSNGRVVIDEKRPVPVEGPGLVACLYQLDKICNNDVDAAVRVCSTVQVQTETKTRECLRHSEKDIQGKEFEEFVHTWISNRMKVGIRNDLAPLLARYPAHALMDALNEFVVEDVHET